jgi:hypothetical protein
VLCCALADVGPRYERLALPRLPLGSSRGFGGALRLLALLLGSWRLLGLFRRLCRGLGLSLLYELEDVLLANAAAGSSALDLIEVHGILVGKPAHERGDDAPLRGVS